MTGISSVGIVSPQSLSFKGKAAYFPKKVTPQYLDKFLKSDITTLNKKGLKNFLDNLMNFLCSGDISLGPLDDSLLKKLEVLEKNLRKTLRK